MENGKRTQAAPPRRRKKSVARRIFGFIRGVFLTLWTVLLIGVLSAGVGLYYFKQYVDVSLAPSLQVRAEDYTMNLSSFVYYQDKETGNWVEWQSVHGEENRVLVDFDQIPDYLWQATVSIEDQRFFEHSGVDWKRTLGAVKDLILGDGSYGGSTLTQQLLKNMTEDNKPYINRKIREIFRALEFEKNYNKKKILELYLNTIFLGKGCYGVQTAAQYYFNKDVSELDLAECASLIAITNNPSMYGPMYNITITREDGTTTTPREANKVRQGWVLDKMAEIINPETGQPYITKAQAEAAKAEVLQFSDGSTSADEIVEQATGKIEINSWFVDRLIQEVAADLAAKNGIETEEAKKLIYNSGYKIYTTLDPEIQAIAESVYKDRSNLDVTSRGGQQLQSGITILDPYTGNVVAMVGKVGEKDRNQGWNYAVGKRQVGSSMKPLTAYAPALDAGTITPGTAFDNYPVRLLNGSPWPKNSPNTYTGFTSVRYGIQQSINTIAVQALESVGVEEAFRFATENLGLSLEPEDMAEGALGMGGLTKGLNTVEMAAAYACFANGGIYNSPRMYLRVTRLDSSTGQEITVLENEGESHVAMKETTAYMMTDMLKNAVAHGTGGSANFSGMTIAGKTGTTNNNYDRYFVGYTPYYVAAVWTGYDQNEKISYNGNPAITMWKKVMQEVHAGLPNKNFDLSSAGLEQYTVCADSGLLCTEACRADPRGSRAVSFLMPTSSKPTASCPLHTLVDYCSEGHCLATEDCPAESIIRVGVLDYVRENYGISLPADNVYTLTSMQRAIGVREDGTSGCPVHSGMLPVEEDPENPLDPNDPNYNPDLPYDPNDPFIPIQPNDPSTTPEGNGGGTTTAPNTTPTPTPTPVPDPVMPVEPAEPEPPAPTGGGNWFDDLWNNA